jgi:hypothetical protein
VAAHQGSTCKEEDQEASANHPHQAKEILMSRYRSRIPSPPSDVVDTQEEYDGYYTDMEDAIEEARVGPDEY